jgi:hypothetical protein
LSSSGDVNMLKKLLGDDVMLHMLDRRDKEGHTALLIATAL